MPSFCSSFLDLPVDFYPDSEKKSFAVDRIKAAKTAFILQDFARVSSFSSLLLTAFEKQKYGERNHASIRKDEEG